MSKLSDGGPAFPVPCCESCCAGPEKPGMSLRDWFAGRAPVMPPELVRLAYEHADIDNPNKTHGEKSAAMLDILAEWRVMYADAQIAALKK